MFNKLSSTSQQLVALIPYDDERLKPKKTAVYVTLSISGAVLACAVIAGLLVYFMMPRPVEINMVGVRKTQSFHILSIKVVNLTDSLNERVQILIPRQNPSR